MIKKFFLHMWSEAMNHNLYNIQKLLEENRKAVLLDVGCGDGEETMLFQQKVYAVKTVGLDGVEKRLHAAKKFGVDQVIKTNLEAKWPIKTNSIDIVVSNQVIEHIVNIDHFIEEIYRVLKPGGYCVISTENLSSWHNIFALVLGFQDFSHHIINKKHLGNPLSPHYGEKTASWSGIDHSGVDDSAFPHMKIMTYRSLINSFTAFGFMFVKGIGSGYYPLFSFLSLLASTLDPYHSHFITVKMRKKQ